MPDQNAARSTEAHAASVGRLMDVATIARELGVSRSVAEKIHRQLPKITVPGVRKVWVERSAVEQLLKQGRVAA